jgi:hypothetical protein
MNSKQQEQDLEREIIANSAVVKALVEAAVDAHALLVDLEDIGTFEDDETEDASDTIRALYKAVIEVDPSRKQSDLP